jgi:hypothetical protein
VCDQPEHRNLLERLGDEIDECLPEKLRNDEVFVRSFRTLCGVMAGWIIGKTLAKLLFPKDDDK